MGPGDSKSVASVAHRKLRQIHRAVHSSDLAALPGNRLEALKGNRAGQHSIRINDQYRVCFVWQVKDAYDVGNSRLSLSFGFWRHQTWLAQRKYRLFTPARSCTRTSSCRPASASIGSLWICACRPIASRKSLRVSEPSLRTPHFASLVISALRRNSGSGCRVTTTSKKPKTSSQRKSNARSSPRKRAA